MFLKRILAAGAFVLASAIAANAADIPPMPPPPPPAIPPAPIFDWSGPYAGVYGGYFFFPGYPQGGLQSGYNFTSGGFLAGIEAQAGVLVGTGIAFEANLNARVGVLLAPKLLVYGEGGVGWIPSTPIFTYNFGGGIEVAAGAAMSVFAEAKGIGGFGPTGTCCAITVQGGLNWHPAY